MHHGPRGLSYKERVPIKKKDGDLRICVDCKGVNKLTVRDSFPLPVIEDCLEHLGGKKYFSTLDLKDGFHQIKMHEDFIKCTAFATPWGLYEYVRMPQGLKNGPPFFQRYINWVLRSLVETGKIVVYMDDIKIASENLKEHCAMLSEVLRLLSEAGLKLNFKKCKFAYRELECLGYLVNENGIRPSNAHLPAIQNFPVPSLFSYFRRFVADFSRVAWSMTNLTKNDVIFEWNDEFMNACLTLREKLVEAPVLSNYSPHRETELHTDASSHGFGAVLMQKQDDGNFHPVAYCSTTTSDAES